LNTLCIAVIFTLSVIFLVILLSVAAAKGADSIMSKTEDSGYVEAQLRELLKKYPKSEIYVTNTRTDAESREILRKLARDFPQIHIKE